jgi:UDP-N-acetylmuramyl pentapeptide phosphotransferase/UDP-N-acetylglucosamine-1-phosphate transferase
MTIYPPIIAAVVTFLLTIILLRSKTANKIQDIPNERSLHKAPVPRIGGMALVLGMFAGWAMVFRALPWWIVAPLLLLFSVSVLDDMRGLSVRYRLLVHLIAAGLLVLGTGLFAQHIWLGIMVLLLVVWMTNLYNFMDGSDGLAGGMALIGFAVYGIAAMQGKYIPFALLNFSIAAAALSFLYFNFYPARVFMGDAGSIPLGFLAAAMGLWGWQIKLWPAWFPLLVFSPFVLDATVTLFKRALRKEKVWQAHREHYYQRVVQIGFGHRNTALVEYALMAGTGMIALLVLKFQGMAIVIVPTWGAIILSVMLFVDHRWKISKHA